MCNYDVYDSKIAYKQDLLVHTKCFVEFVPLLRPAGLQNTCLNPKYTNTPSFSLSQFFTAVLHRGFQLV